jgi:ERCC4-type nuclease
MMRFGSIERLRDASAEEIQDVGGIGPRLAGEIHSFLSRKGGPAVGAP